MFCVSCGQRIPDGAARCPSCGVATGSSAAPSGGRRARFQALLTVGIRDTVEALKVLQRLPIDAGNVGDIFGRFEAALDFQRSHANFN